MTGAESQAILSTDEKLLVLYSQPTLKRGNMTTNAVPSAPTFQIEEFTRKPFKVQGARVTDRNMVEVAKWCGGTIKPLGEHDGRHGPYIEVRVNRPLFPRQTQAFAGDWVLYTPSGGYKVYTDKAFHASFERPALFHGDQKDLSPEELLLKSPIELMNECI